MRLLLLMGAVVGCKAPAEAPEELNELTAFIFEHIPDEDPAYLEQGVTNLEAWMTKRLAETKDGYVVDNLTTKSVGELDQCTRDISGLIGAAVGTTSKHDVDSLIGALLEVDPLRVNDAFISYERDVLLNDVDCFTQVECNTFHYDAYSSKKFALGIEVEGVSRAQWRWVEMDDGWAAVQRTWLALPLKASPAWVNVQEQFYLNVIMPWNDGKSVRMQAVWAVTEFNDAPVPENMALQLAIKQMQDDAEIYDDWLDND